MSISGLAGALLLLAGVSAHALELTLDPASSAGAAVELAVGDDLRVGAAGLPPESSAELRLRDPDGTLVAAVQVSADADGNAGAELLWRRTGVVGCDCDADVQKDAFRFDTFETAEGALLGTQWSVELVDGAGQQLLASRSLLLVETTETQIYVSDAAGCPRRRLEPDEDIFLSLRGPGVPPSVVVFLVEDRPDWQELLPPVDVRTGIGPDGELLEGLSGPLSTARIWPGDPTRKRSGSFAVLVAHHLSEVPAERIPKVIEAGVTIKGWDCRLKPN